MISGTFWKKLFSAAIFERIFQEKGTLLDFVFPFFSYNFGPSLLLPICFGCHATFILGQLLDHSGTVLSYEKADFTHSNSGLYIYAIAHLILSKLKSPYDIYENWMIQRS